MIPGNSPLLFGSTAAQYQITRSLRFNSADSAYLSRTPSVAGNRKTWTWASWVKLAGGTTNCVLLEAATDASNRSHIALSGGNRLVVSNIAGAATVANVTLARLLRDTAAWYHIVVSATTSTLSVYINGELQTAFSNNAQPGGQNWSFNLVGLAHRIGNASQIASPILNGYLADVHWIDGQALTASSFGQFDATTGEWTPIAYTGTYGTNGFRLDFSDNSSATATTLGADRSGNGNNWIPTNFSVAAGSGNDSMVDTPTSYGTDTGVGGEVRGNYCTLNPLRKFENSFTFANGNLDVSTPNDSQLYDAVGTIAIPTSGKYYWEATLVSAVSGDFYVGLMSSSRMAANSAASGAGAYRSSNDIRDFSDVMQTSGSTYTAGDVIGVAVNADAGTVQFYKNNVAQGGTPSFSYTAGQSVWPRVSTDNLAGAASCVVNFGQRPFAYTAPSGYKALCDTNLPTPTIAKPSTVMDVVTYTGTGSALTPTSSLGFSPDLVWIKGRSGATDYALYDTVRGVQLDLVSNSTAAETTQSTGLTAFNSNGFTIGSLAKLNTNTATYAAWCWDENVSAGFDIVTYTGNGANRTIAHSLGVAPQFIIVKQRTTASTTNWAVWHSALANTEYLLLNTTAAKATSSTYWNSTSPTVSVFSLGTAADVNTNSGTYVAYCFAPVAGYSAFGSYTGNGSEDGPFVYCGFRPRWVMVKNTTTAAQPWLIWDAARNTSNVMNTLLEPNATTAEYTASTVLIDALSNGFKIRGTDSGVNASNATCLYCAFAEFPFQYARAR